MENALHTLIEKINALRARVGAALSKKTDGDSAPLTQRGAAAILAVAERLQFFASGLSERRARYAPRVEGFLEWVKIYGRRILFSAQNMAAGHRAAGPVSFLAVSAALGLATTLTTLYTTSYAVYVDGEELGLVSNQAVVENAIALVETTGQDILGYDYAVDTQVDFKLGLSLKSDLTDEGEIEGYFFQQLDEVSVALRRYQVVVDGKVVGSVKNETALEKMLDEIKRQYYTESTLSAEFVEQVTVEPVYNVENELSVDAVKEILTANTTGETTYTVVKGDTFNAIAYANDMSASELKALNPDVNINRLQIGDVLNVKKIIPFLSVQTMEQVTYTQAIECPVETVDDKTMYQGNSKILVQGQEGEALIEAAVYAVNGYETERVILSSTTLREPTTTTKAVGTLERPRTASSGSFCWPYSGRISSYFGGRYIFGSYSYHSGLDISGSYGATIVAADGGTVTFSGWKGSYGNLVIITHDNGTQTYYGHCSSLWVSAGEKVYKGQGIAGVGSTGRSTGNHVHFEVRVNGTAVNPLSYLP